MLLRSRLIQKLGGGFVERTGLRTWSRLMLTSLAARKDEGVVKLMRQIHCEGRSLLGSYESFMIHSLARAQARLPGAFAEVGVFQGASAKVTCEAKGDKPLHLFDTFEGLPESHAHDRGIHRKGQYACSLESVEDYLTGYTNLYFYKGLFPDSAVNVSDDQFAFAHFDVDLYEGTLACLQYFYPRMVPGGIMISHDYDLLAGVRQAFTEFMADKPEHLIELPTTQCMVVRH